MTSYLYLSSLKDFGRLQKMVAWFGLGLVLVVIAIFWKSQMPDSTSVAAYQTISSTLLLKLLALVSLITSTSVISQEIEQKTIVYLLTRPIPRPKLLLTRYFATCTITSLVGIWMAFCLAMATMGPSGVTNSHFFRDCLAVTCGSLAYGAVFIIFSLLFNRAMLIGIIYAFGWELFVSLMPGDQYYLAIMTYLSAIAGHEVVKGNRVTQALAGSYADQSISAPLGLAVVAILTVVLLSFATWWFTRNEYVPREDAE